MRDAEKGTYNGETTYCTVNAYGACPYCDQCNVCHIDDPMEDCDDFQAFFDSWDEWLALDDTPDDPFYEDWDNLECGFDPYSGCYTDDC